MKKKALIKKKKTTTDLRKIMYAEMCPSSFAEDEGLQTMHPYSMRVDWIDDGHIWEANLTMMLPEVGSPFCYVYYKMDGQIVINRNYVRNSLENMEDEIAEEEQRRTAAIARKKAAKEAEEEEEAKQKAVAARRRKAAALRLQEIMSNSMIDSLHTKYVAIRGGMLVEEGPEVYRWRYGAEGLADLRQDALELGVVL